MDETDFFLTETITVPISFRLFAITQLSIFLTNGKIFGQVGPWLYKRGVCSSRITPTLLCHIKVSGPFVETPCVF